MALFRCGISQETPIPETSNIKTIHIQITVGNEIPAGAHRTLSSLLLAYNNDSFIVPLSTGIIYTPSSGYSSSGAAIIYYKVIYKDGTSKEYGRFEGTRMMESDGKKEFFVSPPVLDENGEEMLNENGTIMFPEEERTTVIEYN